ncbi:MAG: hypothetical protein U9N49_01465 [Campylobacterota bacterium]|nr:hypothetical protein [Campylobacterota bacterium]
MEIRPIRDEHDYESALMKIESLMDAKPDTRAYDELEILSILIENYETKHHPIDMPDPIDAIKFRMEQNGLMQKDLVSIFGNKSRVSEILNRKRRLTLDMIRNLHQELQIPFENLIGKECQP